MTFRRDLPSDFAAARGVLAEIIAIAEEQGLAGDALFEAKLAIEEAFIQAIKKSLASKSPCRQCVEAEISNVGVKIAVRDAE